MEVNTMTINKTKNAAVAAGIAGAVIGAGVTAAAAALSDKETRDKVFSKLNEAKNHAMEMMEKKPETDEIKEHVENAIDEGQKAIYQAKDEMDKESKTL